MVELLVVIGIMGLLFGLAGPALSALKGSGDLNKASGDIQGIIEQARLQAVLQNTYVYVNFHESPSVSSVLPAPAGLGKVWVAAVAVRDSSQWANINAANLTPLGKVQYFDNVHLTNTTPFNLSNPIASNSADLSYLSNNSTPASGIGWPVNTKKTITSFAAGGVCINPSGVVNSTTNWTALPTAIQITLVPARGGQVLSGNKNSAVLQIDSITGAVRTFRP